jgi:hypothetical protein
MVTHRDLAVSAEAEDDEVAVLDEALEEDPAPRLRRLLVLGGDGRALAR